MSVVWIRNHYPQRSGSFETPLKSTSRRHWKVVVDSKGDTAHSIYAAGVSAGVLPVYLDGNPDNLIHRCRRVNIDQQSDSWKHWEAVAEYSSEPFTVTEEEENDTPPLDRSTKISWESVQYEKAVYQDRDGNAFLTSAGEPFAAQLIDDSRWVINLRKNVPTVPSFLLSFNNVLNDDTFTIQGIDFPEETLKTQGIKVSEQKNEQNTTFYELSMSLHYRQEGWAIALLDEGYYEKVGSDYSHILDDSGDKVTTPMALSNGVGNPEVTPSTAEYREFDVYTAADFGVLPF